MTWNVCEDVLSSLDALRAHEEGEQQDEMSAKTKRKVAQSRQKTIWERAAVHGATLLDSYGLP